MFGKSRGKWFAYTGKNVKLLDCPIFANYVWSLSTNKTALFRNWLCADGFFFHDILNCAFATRIRAASEIKSSSKKLRVVSEMRERIDENGIPMRWTVFLYGRWGKREREREWKRGRAAIDSITRALRILSESGLRAVRPIDGTRLNKVTEIECRFRCGILFSLFCSFFLRRHPQ